MDKLIINYKENIDLLNKELNELKIKVKGEKYPLEEKLKLDTQLENYIYKITNLITYHPIDEYKIQLEYLLVLGKDIKLVNYRKPIKVKA